jgi:hypothetical protein
MFDCILTKIYRDPKLEGGLRSNNVKGQAEKLPCLEKPFIMFAEPFNKTAELDETAQMLNMVVGRMVQTSPLKLIEGLENTTYTLTTTSGSKYKLEH